MSYDGGVPQVQDTINGAQCFCKADHLASDRLSKKVSLFGISLSSHVFMQGSRCCVRRTSFQNKLSI